MAERWKCSKCGKTNMRYVGTCGCGGLKEDGMQLDEDISVEQPTDTTPSSDIVRSKNKKQIIFAVIMVAVAVLLILGGKKIISSIRSAVDPDAEIEGTYFYYFNNEAASKYVLEDGVCVEYWHSYKDGFVPMYSYTYVYDKNKKMLYMDLGELGEEEYKYVVTESGTEYLLLLMDYKEWQEEKKYYKYKQ